ncbi:hypothetical protein [Hyphobacterium sp.]|uniref:hypothetical protein n=1 Tax=Hyphobacterium sp. TaxID=2004662 RepID=UPI003B51FE59
MSVLRLDGSDDPFWVDLPVPHVDDPKKPARVKTLSRCEAVDAAAQAAAYAPMPVRLRDEAEEDWRERCAAVLNGLGYGHLVKKMAPAAAVTGALTDLTDKALARALICEFDGLCAGDKGTPLDAEDETHLGAFMRSRPLRRAWLRAINARAAGLADEGNGSGPSSVGAPPVAAGSVKTAGSAATDAESPEG